MDTNRANPPVAHPVLSGLPALIHPPMSLNQNSPINFLRPIQPLVLPTQFPPPPIIPSLTNPTLSNSLPAIQPRPGPINTNTSALSLQNASNITIPEGGPIPELTSMELQILMSKLKKDLRTKKGK